MPRAIWHSASFAYFNLSDHFDVNKARMSLVAKDFRWVRFEILSYFFLYRRWKPFIDVISDWDIAVASVTLHTLHTLTLYIDHCLDCAGIEWTLKMIIFFFWNFLTQKINILKFVFHRPPLHYPMSWGNFSNNNFGPF